MAEEYDPLRQEWAVPTGGHGSPSLDEFRSVLSRLRDLKQILQERSETPQSHSPLEVPYEIAQWYKENEVSEDELEILESFRLGQQVKVLTSAADVIMSYDYSGRLSPTNIIKSVIGKLGIEKRIDDGSRMTPNLKYFFQTRKKMKALESEARQIADEAEARNVRTREINERAKRAIERSERFLGLKVEP